MLWLLWLCCVVLRSSGLAAPQPSPLPGWHSKQLPLLFLRLCAGRGSAGDDFPSPALIVPLVLWSLGENFQVSAFKRHLRWGCSVCSCLVFFCSFVLIVFLYSFSWLLGLEAFFPSLNPSSLPSAFLEISWSTSLLLHVAHIQKDCVGASPRDAMIKTLCQRSIERPRVDREKHCSAVTHSQCPVLRCSPPLANAVPRNWGHLQSR